MKTRLIGSAALTALLAAMVSLLTAGGSAATGAGPAAEGRFTNYTQANGPELTTQEAAEKAVERVLALESPASPLARALQHSAVGVQVAHSDLATVRAIEDGQQPTEAITTGSDPEQTELLRSSVYLVKIKGQFSPAVPTPQNATAPHGNTVALTLDAHTGFMMGLQVGGAPDIAALGPVAAVSVTAGSPAARAANSLQRKRGPGRTQ